ncbi:MAG: VWA domain-containing protein [Acidobacteria bacterium]|nr:VWA domain-containing protein [Acidobacteriota bacterium]MCA1642578.1 VWA domain-containing protein [Acidobacteriota bacterium]
MTKSKLPLSLALLLVASCLAPATAPAQDKEKEKEEVLQVNTRVVFLDALVTDKKTKAYASDLAPENFEVLADGQPRKISYFTREGDALRKPLALVLVFDLERIGAGRYMRRTDILEAMAKELEKLPPGDEVAVVVLDPGGQEGKREWLTGFTRSRGQIASAMSIIPTLVGAGGMGGGDCEGDDCGGTSVTVNVGDSDRKRVEVKSGETQHAGATPGAEETKRTIERVRTNEAEEGDEVDTIFNKKGEKVTRVLKPDGTLVITKTNKKGEEESDMNDDFDLPRATYEIEKRVARERPGSQPAIVYVTDGIAPMGFDERDFVEDRLNRQNVIFSALVTDMKTGFKLAKPLLSPLGNWAGISIYGVAQHVAKATGGDVVRVHSPADYARGLSQIIGNLNARYSLGFALADAEKDDGVLHPLEVRVKAKDAKGKDRKLEVKARRGYFMPTAPKQQEAKKTGAGTGAAQTKNN